MKTAAQAVVWEFSYVASAPVLINVNQLLMLVVDYRLVLLLLLVLTRERLQFKLSFGG